MAAHPRLRVLGMGWKGSKFGLRRSLAFMTLEVGIERSSYVFPPHSFQTTLEILRNLIVWLDGSPLRILLLGISYFSLSIRSNVRLQITQHFSSLLWK